MDSQSIMFSNITYRFLNTTFYFNPDDKCNFIATEDVYLTSQIAGRNLMVRCGVYALYAHILFFDHIQFNVDSVYALL